MHNSNCNHVCALCSIWGLSPLSWSNTVTKFIEWVPVLQTTFITSSANFFQSKVFREVYRPGSFELEYLKHVGVYLTSVKYL